MTRFAAWTIRLGTAGACLTGAGRLVAQGLTAAALEGTVLAPDGNPVADAEVRTANLANGERWHSARNS